MKQSQLFTKTTKQISKEEVSLNAQLLQRAGFVEKLMAGAYTYSPLGLRVLRKIENIVREEMNKIGGQEVLMPMLHPKENWVTTGGWDSIDILFKVPSRTEKEYALGQSEEEIVTPFVMKRVNTYRELPLAVYQIHWKFRDELRAKSGLLRGREFLMKDMYSFNEDQADFDRFYAIAKQAYLAIFKRMGLTAKVTEASGGSFSEKISYEFMVLTDAGEDDILYCSDCDFCVNVEISKQKIGETCSRCNKGKMERATASEVGNVFDLGQKYGKAFDLGFIGRDGKKQFPVMGCYGIGISRAMGVIVEKNNDAKGIIWPASVAPFQYHLICLGDDAEVKATADKLYADMTAQGKEVLYDDRADTGAGAKFADADLIGLPTRLVISAKTLKENAVEVKNRNEEKAELLPLSQF
ncbi:MAG: hypothetical protein A3J93_00205 [Candidatus Magasanikbacteria bacterium RIFOXYC2_FULL_42_28]|uniref:Proline--tRNA ligase n=1 Tax=Candidatus Magasanikbacteria bacterium RIFOXYC2_FULL_42_28 TaxID=1798704 RepID=A0A1F6NW93_9BACT|nr:MAG: hypothetical protein A3J93_00205 [Candidatus Magasanikbacteria bacterium RIFOXYC2_FULL_42_28]